MTKSSVSVASPTINKSVLMSGADFFDVSAEINSYMHTKEPVNHDQAKADFDNIRAAIEEAGIEIVKVDPPKDCNDGIFTANWGLCRGDTVVLSSLPPQRMPELAGAEKALQHLGKKIIRSPYRYSGQGDSLPCGNLLFCGSNYRTDPRMHDFLAKELGYEVISLEAVPELDSSGQPVTNTATGWPDSFFYDLDLGICVLRPNLIAWYPGAWTKESQDRIQATPINKIEISEEEAMNFACNLISTGSTVVMTHRAPKLRAAFEAEGLNVITVDVKELGKAGGFIRCTTLTLDNA
jgi:N-dimethylarginine dimethylaminohydrolase